MSYTLAIHGGAGTILRTELTQEKEQAYLCALEASLQAGEEILRQGGTALDAVETAVVVLEDCPLFNAGKGAVFANTGNHEMEAAIMCGRSLEGGGAVLLDRIKNPIRLARQVLDHSEHILLSGVGALNFAKDRGLELTSKEYHYTAERYDQLQSALRNNSIHLDHNHRRSKMGTVGAVALDEKGNVAVATSTGGMTNKKYGRIGDSPLIGAGTYANNRTCAVSCTGHGEYFIRGVVAYDVSCLMEYQKLTLEEACRLVIHEKQIELGGSGGLIAVDTLGNVALPFNSEGMYRGWVKKGQPIEVGIFD